MKNILVISFSSFLIFSSCSKEKREATLFWDETLCADPWSPNNTDGLKTFLKSKDIKVKRISMESDKTKEQLCFACSCLNGRIYKVTVKTKDKAKMKEIGFYE